MSMRMLKGNEETESEVTWEDQCKINSFSRLYAQQTNFEDLLAEKKKEKEALDDLAQELELVDEDELLPYQVGESFFQLKQSECLERIEESKTSLDKNIEQLKKQIDSTSGELEQLKAALYKKFGKSINLDI